MASTFTRILLHVVFSTKNRTNLISSEIEEKLHRYIGGIVSNHQCRSLCIGGTANHVHALLSLDKNITIVKLMEIVKKDSSRWVKTQGPQYADFYWQDGYGAFSIGESGVEAVSAYIIDQKRHHRHQSFQEELVALLKKYKIPYDERYL